MSGYIDKDLLIKNLNYFEPEHYNALINDLITKQPEADNIIDYMESECKRFGIKFVRIKPTKTWLEWYYNKSSKTGGIYGFPTRKARWCNNKYKLSAKKQLQDYMKSLGFYTVFYIGYCADEQKRFLKRMTPTMREIYPLAENNVNEDEIWEWAKQQPIYNNYYKTNKRCGCMYCPLASRINYAYLLKYYPENFEFMIERMRETEKIREAELGRPFSVIASNPKYNADYLDNIIRTKWLKILEEKEQEQC